MYKISAILLIHVIVCNDSLDKANYKLKSVIKFFPPSFLRITFELISVNESKYPINFGQADKFFTDIEINSMTLLRKFGLSLREADPPIKTRKMRLKAFSQDNLFPFIDHRYCKKQRKGGDTKRNKKSTTITNERAFSEHEVKKITGKNALTVNFENNNNADALPSITTFDNMKGMLIKKSLFDRYK